MHQLYKNIKSRRLELGMTQDELAEKVGYSGKSMIARIEKGDIDLQIPKVISIAKALNTSPGELVGWVESEDAAVSISTHLPAGYIRIPVLGRVAAGIPIEQIEDAEDFEDIKAPEGSEADYFALRIRGDSMQPLIQDGSVVIVHKQPDAETGEIVIATVNGHDATCKRLKKYAEGIMLVSINPAYDPMVFEQGDVNSLPVSILGKVIEVRTTL